MFRFTLVPLALTALLASCAMSPVYPPIVAPPTDTHRPGTFVWHDLMAHDVEAAKSFYGSLLGWTFRTEGTYTVILNDGRPIGGIVPLATKEGEEPVKSRWVPSLSLPDPHGAARSIAASGGTIHRGPGTLRGRGEFALVSDIQGAPLVLLHSSAGDPPAREAGMGDWLFTVLWTTNPLAAINFYESLAGWSHRQIEAPETYRYWILYRDGKWKAGVAGVTGDVTEATWLSTVRVDDPEAVSARAEEAGGRVLVRPGEPPSDGKTALIADPAGAVFLVESWTDNREESR